MENRRIIGYFLLVPYLIMDLFDIANETTEYERSRTKSVHLSERKEVL